MLSPFRPQDQFSIPRLASSAVLGATLALMLWMIYNLILHVQIHYMQDFINGYLDYVKQQLLWDIVDPERLRVAIGFGNQVDRIEWLLAAVVGAVFGTFLYVFVRRRREGRL